MTDIVERLRAPAYWISGSDESHEGDNSAPMEAARTIEILRVELAKVNMENDRLTRTHRAKREHRDKLLEATSKQAAEIERLRAALRGVLEEAAKVAEDNEPEPSKEEMDDSYDAVAAYRVGRWEAAGDIATAIRALKEGK